MAVSQSLVRNRLLAALPRADYALLSERLAPCALALSAVLIEAHRPIPQVYFPESGIVSALADTSEGRIEIGMIGRDGLVGLPVALGTDRSPHTYLVQAEGAALRMDARALREAVRERPSLLRPFGLYAQALIVQIAQTAYANAHFTLEARLARWVLMTQDRTGGDELGLTHEFLSTMLGVRRPGVTTAVHLLEGTGAIRAERGRVTVRDRAKLRALADDSYQVAEDEYERLMAEA